jgi:IS1 family transposase
VEAYGKVIPQEQHCPCSKQQGETNHLERFNNTLCQRVGRLVRKTLSFSKHLLFHLIHIRAFIRAHNLDCLKRLAPAN